ncbi:MAG: single-stranded DNA-binding protein [Sediminibacterium sp.]
MEITGRITADAKVNTVKGDKEVVNFSIAVNDRYKVKGTKEVKDFVTFINVAWWLNTGITKILKRGAIVTVTGRLSSNAYIDMKGNAKASINLIADKIMLIHSRKAETEVESGPTLITEPIADLPF